MVSWWKKKTQRNSTRTHRLSEIDDVPLNKCAKEMERLKKEAAAATLLLAESAKQQQQQQHHDYQTEDEEGEEEEQPPPQQGANILTECQEEVEIEEKEEEEEALVDPEEEDILSNNKVEKGGQKEEELSLDKGQQPDAAKEDDPLLHEREREPQQPPEDEEEGSTSHQSLEALQQELEKAEEQFNEEELEQMIQKTPNLTATISVEQQIEMALQHITPRELTQLEARRAYSFYAKLAQPSRDKMLREVIKMDPQDNVYQVTLEEVISLPWIMNGSFMNVKKINELIAG